jgi:hypothetical protein
MSLRHSYVDLLQQVSDHQACVRDKTAEALAAGTNIDAIRLRENGVADCHIESISMRAAAHGKKPCLAVSLKAPGRAWSEVNAFESKMRIRCQQRSRVGPLCRYNANIGRPCVCHSKCFVDMKFTSTAMVEETKCYIAALLDFRDYKAGADGVNRSCGDQGRVADMHQLPRHKIGDRAVFYSLAELL